ncbi:HNH endonuclease signature motif containing protein [Nocardioides baculatus]|uniref:HNH endonuclease n=1 Tax=Nocardioides baculatus TaxID=2801337 RepID=A0ABS1L5Z2_9ACTN|nr:HNH endonuclease [Nocardioides baculatus]
MTTRRTYTRELLAETVASSTSMAGVMRSLGLVPAGGTHAHLRRTIEAFEIDTSHFRRGLPTAQHHARKGPDQILVRLPHGARRASPHMLTRGLVESGVPYACAFCGCDGTWQGLALTLEVDHMDGDYLNNLISNLRFLCPNCHRQTPNPAGRSRGKYTTPHRSTDGPS